MFLHVLHGQPLLKKEFCVRATTLPPQLPTPQILFANTSWRASHKAQRRQAAPPTATCRAIPNRTGTPRRSRQRHDWDSQSRMHDGQNHLQLTQALCWPIPFAPFVPNYYRTLGGATMITDRGLVSGFSIESNLSMLLRDASTSSVP